MSAQDNGFLEVENAKIRGTLRTTVFEKETVNAVGGQLQVGNATTITGSASISATATQIPVENVSGFTGSEVIMAKKVGNTGFSTEYMLITSQSRRDSTSNTDFSGSLFVVRGYSGSASQSQVTSSLGDSPTPATTLEPGQVLVSTGFYNANTNEGSGYIRLNANPNDSSTPFMDIVERTGSAIYDVDLKVRLGDLSGLSSGLVGSNPGFGLFTNKVFLQGNDPTSASIALGSTPPTSVNYTSNAGIYMDGSGDFLVRGDNDNFIKFDVSDKLSIAAEDFELDAGGLKLIGNSSTAANNQIRLATATAINTGHGLFASGDGKFRVGSGSGHRLEFDGTNLVVSSSDFFLGSKGSNNAYISSSGNVLEISSSKFSLNSDGTVEVEGSISITSGDLAGVTKAKISGSSDALSGSLATRHTLSEATSSTLKTDSGSLAARLKLDSNGVDILNSSDVSVAQLTNSLRIGRDAAGQSRLEIDSSGNLSIINRQGSTDTNVIQLLANGNSSFSGSGTFGGAITATSGKIAGWDINSNRLDSTNDKVILDGNNNNGEIRLGSSPPTSATNGAGIYLGGDGTFLVGDADGHRVSFENSKLIVSSSTFFLGSKGSSNAYISSSGDVLEISSSKFALKKNGDVSIEGTVTATAGEIGGFTIDADEIKAGSTLILDSDTNSGQIKLGGASSITGGNDGVYMDGTGDFRVGDADGERISFDQSAGLLIMSSSTFMIGSKADSKSFISASGAGDLEISSSNFHLLGGNVTASNVDLSGKLTATSGDIGGWNINSNDLVGGSVRLFQEGIIQLTGNADFAGASKDALGEISGSGTIGPSFELKRKSYNANYVDVVKINTSGSYDNTDTYVNNEDKQTVSITRSGTTSEQSAVATFGASQTTWDESYYIKAKDSSNQTVAELDTSAPGSNELIDLGAANQVFELVFQNLQEAAKPQIGSPSGGSPKSLYRYRFELYQNDSNTTSGAELVGSFNISSVLTLNSSFSFADLNTSATTFFPFRRYIYVKVVGTRYDELTGDNGSGTEHSLNMSGAPFSITSYVPKTRVNAVGLQSL